MNEIRTRLQSIENKIANAAQVSGRSRGDVTLLGVTKTWPSEVVREAYEQGIRAFGENYVQEMLIKEKELEDLAVQWHFIGHLQSNKVKQIVGRCELIHSVDRIGLANEISKRQGEAELPPQPVLIEVNVAVEASKSGVSWDELPRLLDEVQNLSGVVMRGLMVMPPLQWSTDELKQSYLFVRGERDRLASRLSAPHNLLELSMGTSHDYEVAVECGATIVRLGSALFGERHYVRS